MPTFRLKLNKAQRRETFHLPVEQSIYVPKTRSKNIPITNQAMDNRVKDVQNFFTESFGGTTSTKAVGTYDLESGKRVREPVVKVTSFSTVSDSTQSKDKVINRVRTYGKKWGQESVSYEHEGDLYVVNARK